MKANNLTIALAGNPNSGKTTMFNALTGANQHVGNWPGVTVEKKDGRLKGKQNIVIQDLPGIYSLSPYTPEEVITRNYLVTDKPAAIVNIVDASNLERNLYLTTQLTELGIPVVLALNMMDVVRKRGDRINTDRLSEVLGVAVVETSATRGEGCLNAAEKAIWLAEEHGRHAHGLDATHDHSHDVFQPKLYFSQRIETALKDISEIVAHHVEDANLRWYSIKAFERDSVAMQNLALGAKEQERVEAIIKACEDELDDDSESIIANQRYGFISSVIDSVITYKSAGSLTISDKIDKVVTNRLAALPIFAVVMFLVYYLSIMTVGTSITDWVNDGLFGDGFYISAGQEQLDEASEDYGLAQLQVDSYLTAAEDAGLATEEIRLGLEEGELDEQALAGFIAAATAAKLTATAEVIDEEGNVEEEIPVGIAEFSEAMSVPEPDPTEFGLWVSGIPVALGGFLVAVEAADWLSSLLIDGIVGGVGAVLGFLPQMLVLFLLLALLEECGYMARIAFIMDRIFKRFGLSGKSFIPILIGTGCGVPGVLASRTIENESNRRLTVMTTTFIPCSAKLPIIALITGALFAGSSLQMWIGPLTYFIGIAAIICSGVILKKVRLFAGDPSPFLIELPAYHLPRPKSVLRVMLERAWAFVKRAGTIILLATILVWFLSSFDFSMSMVDTSDSILAALGNTIAWIFAPLGWGDWQAAVASITGLIAKENVVGTFGVLYGFSEVAENGLEVWGTLAASFTAISAFSFLLFNMLCAPCFAAIGAIHREMASPKWTFIAIAYQCVFAYIVAFCFFQIASLVTGGEFGVATAIAFLLVAAFLYLLFRPNPANRAKKREAKKVSAQSVA